MEIVVYLKIGSIVFTYKYTVSHNTESNLYNTTQHTQHNSFIQRDTQCSYKLKPLLSDLVHNGVVVSFAQIVEVLYTQRTQRTQWEIK